nr:uncharacterized protein LOC109154045 [Ipomoea batatas]
MRRATNLNSKEALSQRSTILNERTKSRSTCSRNEEENHSVALDNHSIEEEHPVDEAEKNSSTQVFPWRQAMKLMGGCESLFILLYSWECPLDNSILSNSGFILRLKHGGFLGKGENPNYVGGLTAMYNNIEIDEWGLITLLDKMKELGYACVDTVQFFMKTVRGLVELVTDKVAWDTFNELDLFDVVEVWAVGGEMNESFGEDSSYDGEIGDSDCGSLDDLDYEINIDPNVEYCGEDHHVISKDGQHLNRVHVKLHCTVCKKEGHNRRKCPLNPTVSNRQNNPRRRSTTKKQGPTCSSASQVDPTSTQAAPVDPTSSQAPPVDQTSIEAPPVDQTSSPSDAQPAGMEDDITDQMLADLDIDAFVSNLIDDSGIGSGQQQQAPQVQWRFSMYTLGGRGSSGAQGPEEIEVHTNSTQPPTDGDKDTQAAMDDDNATERPNPCHKAKKIKVIKSKHVVNGRKYGTRARFAALKAKFPPTSADSPCNVD